MTTDTPKGSPRLLTGWPVSDEALALIRGAPKIVTCTHRGPDADGLGSEIAFALAARRAGVACEIVNHDAVPRRFRWLDPDGLVRQASSARDALAGATIGLSFDTNDPYRAGDTHEALKAQGTRFFVVDHHELPGGSTVEGIVATRFSSTGELTWRLLRALGWLSADPRQDAAIAWRIWASIAYDTGSFRFVRNDPETFRACAELLETGIDANPVQERLWSSDPRDVRVLAGSVLASMQFAPDARICYAVAPRGITDGLEVERDDLGELIRLLVDIDGVEIAFMLKETDKPGHWKLSLRSKSCVTIDHIAQSMGGGGHAHAAGATVPDALASDVDALRARIVAACTAALETHRNGA